VPAAPVATLEAASEEAAVELLLDAPQAASAPAVTPLITAAEASFKKLLREIFFIAFLLTFSSYLVARFSLREPVRRRIAGAGRLILL
jgi:hypothetical protein